MLPRIRKLLLMLTFRLTQRRRLSLLIKLIPCLLLVTYVVNKISPIVSEDGRSIGYDYQHDQIAFQQPTQPSIPLTPYALRAFINSTNDQQIILNLDKYGPLTPIDPIIVVQVHDRVDYLKFLIKSLETVQGIDKTLLILTHDVYNPIINSIVKSIGFCKVIQLFYPFSIQAYPDEFPGTDPKDCPRDVKQQEAIALRCRNAEHPDTYGHYREAVYTQTKHHWFWKMNTIFDKLNMTKNHDGPFIFLEEDHYAAPDMLYVLKSMMDLKLRSNLDVDIFTLGAYVKVFNYLQNSDKLEINKWASNLHNMGFVLFRSVWNKIRSCSKNFCTYDDYNWDWSLQYISEKCMTRPLKTLSVIAPRVFHIGECGVHHKKSDCSKNQLINKVRQTLKAAVNYLFPSQLIVQKTTKRSTKMSKVNGGWADIRDHILCLQQVVYVDKMEEF